MLWFAGQFGKDLIRRDIILPATFIRAADAATPERVGALVRRISVLIGVPRERIALDLFDGTQEKKAATSGSSRAVGHYREVNGRAVIAVDLSEAEDPAYMTAIIAHELCHARLLGERRITARRPDHERLTDLLAVYFGFGIFSANAALRYSTARSWSVQPRGELDERTLNAARHDGYSRLGYLTEREFG